MSTLHQQMHRLAAGITLSACVLLGGTSGWALSEPDVPGKTVLTHDMNATIPDGYYGWVGAGGFACIGGEDKAAGSFRFGSFYNDPGWTLDNYLINPPTSDSTNGDFAKGAFLDSMRAFLYVDGVDDEFEIGQDGRMTRDPYVVLNNQTGGYEWLTDDAEANISVKFSMKLVGPVVRWEYTIKNASPDVRRIGFRLVEMVNAEGEPLTEYYLPVQGSLHTVQEYTGSQVPPEWSLRYIPAGKTLADYNYRPLLQARQPLQDVTTRPQRVVFGSEDNVVDYSWPAIYDAALPENQGDDPVIKVGSMLDSDSFAVGLYYAQTPVRPGETRVIKGEFQLNWATLSTLNQNALAVWAPDSVEYRNEDDMTTPEIETGYLWPAQFNIRAYTYNASGSTSPDVSVSIDLGNGLQLAPQQDTNYKYEMVGISGRLAAKDANDAFSWTVVPTGTASGRIPIRVTATFSTGGSTTTTVYVNVPALPKRTLAPGDHFLGLPFTYANPDAGVALGLGPNVQLAEYNPQTSAYRYAGVETIDLAPAHAYWLHVPSTTTLALQGATPVDQKAAYDALVLARGWNGISNPYQYSIQWGNCQVIYNGEAYSIEEAVSRGWIRRELWAWDQVNKQYTFSNLYTTELKPFTGYWLYASSNVTLNFRPDPYLAPMNRSAFGTTPGRTAGTTTDWRVNILAETPSGRDAVTTFGVAADAVNGPSDSDLMEPPMSPVGLSAYFPRNDWGRSAGRYAVDLQAPGTVKTWTMEVLCTKAHEQVTLRWPDLTQLPAGMPVMLTDEFTGQQIAMRTSPGYTFTSGEGGVRRFTITAGGTIDRLHFTQTQVVAGRGKGAGITYGLSIPANVKVSFRTQTGKLVRVLPVTRAATAGLSTVRWDGCDAKGHVLPAGIYLCELYAEAADGQRVRATLTVNTK